MKIPSFYGNSIFIIVDVTVGGRMTWRHHVERTVTKVPCKYIRIFLYSKVGI
jgi:hypothetical protein